MMDKLNVWVEAQHAATLTYSEGVLGFRYTAPWLESDSAIALSHSLPLQPETFEGTIVNAFFGGLLPEGRLRDLIARHQHVSTGNDFSLLQILGGECAGALALLPPDQKPAIPNHSTTFLTNAELTATLKALPTRPMLAGEDGIRLSLAGAQDKLPVIVDGNKVAIPKNGAVSTHILKMPIYGLEGTVDNEAFCLSLADKVGITAAKAHVLETNEVSVLLVKRYDRPNTSSRQLGRLHQEDFCQALGIASHSKYQREGGPSITNCFQLLRDATKPFAPQILRLLDYVIFNALVGNHDAHGKNFSLLYDGQASLAPLYDVVCTAIYPELTPKMAMKIGSQYQFSDVLPRHWEQLATDAGMTSKLVIKKLGHWASVLPAASTELMNNHYKDNKTISLINSEIAHRCEKTLRLI